MAHFNFWRNTMKQKNGILFAILLTLGLVWGLYYWFVIV